MWLFWVTLLFILFSGFIFSSKQLKEKYKIGKIEIGNLYIYCVILFLMFLAMFRSIHVGNDTANYVDMFCRYGTMKFSEMGSLLTEPGFFILVKVLYSLTTNAQILIIVTSIITYCGFARFIKKNTKDSMERLFALVILYCIFYRFSLSAIRQCIALSIVVGLSYEYMIQRKPIKFVLSMMLAISFHYTSVIFLLMYPYSTMKRSKKITYISIIITILSYFMFDYVLEIVLVLFPKYQYYLGGIYLNGVTRLASILNAIFIITIYLFRHFFVKKNVLLQQRKKEDLCINYNMEIIDNMMFLGICISILALKFNLFDRLATYFTIFEIIYVPFIYKNVKAKNKMFIFILFIGMFVSKAAIEYYLKPEWNLVFPYSFFWNK